MNELPPDIRLFIERMIDNYLSDDESVNNINNTINFLKCMEIKINLKTILSYMTGIIIGAASISWGTQYQSDGMINFSQIPQEDVENYWNRMAQIMSRKARELRNHYWDKRNWQF